MDSMYPNDSDSFYVPEVPEERQLAEQKELDSMTASLPVLEEVVSWFDEEIRLTDSISSLKLNLEVTDEQLTAQLRALSILKTKLEGKRNEFVTRFDNFKLNIEERRRG